ncbi:hypothetical protein AB0F17_34560 [Nonomuraea sp. NPDC026600]|uniref:hypothetical protein n=1 Tax=Nonomuraea sp. NPDC026600 TaxID=3155363 RepID=UPI0033D3720D
MKFALLRRTHRGAHASAAAADFGSHPDADHEQWIASLAEPDPEPGPVQPPWEPAPYASTATDAR